MILPTHLSENFSIEEALFSETAERKNIPNTPSAETLEVMKKTAIKMEKVRALLSNPIRVTSWYRSPALNFAIGSSDTSQHPKGEAVDFVCNRFGSPLDICRAIIANQELIRFDQLILEHTWVHISFAILTGKPKGQVLSLLSNKAYAPGLTDKNGIPY